MAISNKAGSGTIRIYQYTPTISLKATLTLSENASYPTSLLKWMTEIISSKFFLALGNKNLVDIWDISNLNSVVLVKTYTLDNGNPSDRVYDYISSFKDSSNFALSQHGLTNLIQRVNFESASPGIISQNLEFDSNGGAANEFTDPLIRFEKDDLDDLIVAYTRTTTGPTNTLFSYQWQCDYLRQNGGPICYDCYTDRKITESTLANCKLVSTVRFFTYKITHNLAKVNDPKNFYGILTLENFDINTNVVPNLQTWLETNIVLTPALPSFVAPVTFDAVPVNIIPAGGKIDLPFKI